MREDEALTIGTLWDGEDLMSKLIQRYCGQFFDALCN
jgi:hypothetical protein